MRRSAPAVLALIAANLVPLAGVAFLGWRLYDVLLVYWLENGVIGAFNLLRMVTVGRARSTSIFFVPFFAFHYGMFWVVHGVFVVTLFAGEGPFAAATAGAGTGPAGAAAGGGLPLLAGRVPTFPGLGWALSSLSVSHGVSFVQNWLVGGERLGATPADRMRAPYGRVVVLHLALLGGGLAVAMLGAPVVALVVLVVLKIGLDLRAHAREHGLRGPVPAIRGAR